MKTEPSKTALDDTALSQLSAGTSSSPGDQTDLPLSGLTGTEHSSAGTSGAIVVEPYQTWEVFPTVSD